MSFPESLFGFYKSAKSNIYKVIHNNYTAAIMNLLILTRFSMYIKLISVKLILVQCSNNMINQKLKIQHRRNSSNRNIIETEAMSTPFTHIYTWRLTFPVVDWFCLFIYLWVLTFPLLGCSEFGNFVITLIWYMHFNTCKKNWRD
jgi:hypothetical protein